MDYLTLDLPNGNLVLSDNSVWKSLSTWLDGGTLYSDYYDASGCGDYWKASEHWINIDSSSTYLSFTIEYDFVNASATDSCLCQIKYDETTHGIAVTADSTGLNIQGATSVKHIDCDYSNANIKIDIVANLLTKGITTYIHKNDAPLIKVVNSSSSYTFTKFVIQAGALGADIYTSYKLLPTTTKLLNVSVSDDDITYSDFTDTTNYVNKSGVAEMWTNTKNYISAQLLGKSDVGHTHSASDITSGLATVATSGSYNDLSNKPTIPTKTSDLSNDSGFITSDNTKIPLAGTNALAGSIVPDTDNAYILGDSNNKFKNVKTNLLSTFQVAPNTDSESLLLNHDLSYGGFLGSGLVLRGKNSSIEAGCFNLLASNGTNTQQLIGSPNGILSWSGNGFRKTKDTSFLDIFGSSGYMRGAQLTLFGQDINDSYTPGIFRLMACRNNTKRSLEGLPNGTLAWNGQPIQYISDQRYKQQIAEIDDKLLDAWEDVDLVQFKYNDAVDQKKDKARLHTGYVVQQIDNACKSHGVDISEYGLYCHEEYHEETEEVEVESENGTKTKEKKVIREASEHYSLRYTEALIVECAYLRKCIKELRNEIEELKSSK